MPRLPAPVHGLPQPRLASSSTWPASRATATGPTSQRSVYERGPLSPRHENGLFHFHEMVRNTIGPAVKA